MVWEGVIIEESLESKDLLKLAKTVKTKKSTLESEEEKGFLHFHHAEVSDGKKEEFVEEAKNAIKQGWYLHICKDGKMIVVFKGKSFEFTKLQKDKIEQAKKYGMSIGIIEEQVQFQELIDNPYG